MWVLCTRNVRIYYGRDCVYGMLHRHVQSLCRRIQCFQLPLLHRGILRVCDRALRVYAVLFRLLRFCICAHAVHVQRAVRSRQRAQQRDCGHGMPHVSCWIVRVCDGQHVLRAVPGG